MLARLRYWTYPDPIPAFGQGPRDIVTRSWIVYAGEYWMNAYWRGATSHRPAAARRFLDAQTTEVMEEIKALISEAHVADDRSNTREILNE